MPSNEFLFHLIIDDSQSSTFPTHFYVFHLKSFWKKLMIFSYDQEKHENLKDFEAFRSISLEDFDAGNIPKDLSINLQVFYDVNENSSKHPKFQNYFSWSFREPTKTSKKLLVYFQLTDTNFPSSLGFLGVANKENCQKYDIKSLNILAWKRVSQ
jgi:hypothetical protein